MFIYINSFMYIICIYIICCYTDICYVYIIILLQWWLLVFGFKWFKMTSWVDFFFLLWMIASVSVKQVLYVAVSQFRLSLKPSRHLYIIFVCISMFQVLWKMLLIHLLLFKVQCLHFTVTKMLHVAVVVSWFIEVLFAESLNLVLVKEKHFAHILFHLKQVSEIFFIIFRKY